MSDFSVTVGGDFSELLAGFRKLEQDARASGQTVGKGIAEGIQGFSTKSIAALQAELARLQSRQTRVAIDSTAFEKTGQRIREVQGLLTEVERRRLTVGVDDRSITALQTKLAALQSKQTKVSVDSREFADLQREIDKLEGELDAISRKKLLINADGNSVLALTSKIRGELDALEKRRLRVDVDSQEFADLGREIDKLEGDLLALERKRTQINVDDRSIQALQQRLSDLQQKQTRVSVDSRDFITLQREIDKTQREIAEVERKKVLINVSTNSFTALFSGLERELNRLQQRQIKVDIDSREFQSVSAQISQVERELQALQQRKLLINADPNSIIALNSKLGTLRGELEKVAIGSQRFKELQGEIRKTEQELNDANGEAKGLAGILSGGLAAGIAGVVAGFASIGAIGGLFKGAFDQAVQFETITRKLSNTLGAQGAASALSFTKKLSDDLGLSYKTLSNAFGSFTAAATASGVPLQQQKDLFAAVSKSAQSLGLSNDELSGSLLALQQVASKGTVQMEELRGQLGERLPVAFGATAKGLGITQQELIKLVETGRLTSEQFFTALTKGLNELNAGATGLPTTQQNLDKLNNAWTEFGATVGDGIKSVVNPLIVALTNLGKGLTDVTRALVDAPGPVKALIAAVVGIPTAYVAARLAVIAFNSELISGKFNAALDGIKQIGSLLKGQFIADVATAKAAWAAFKASIETGQLQQQIGALAAKFGPLALAAGGVAAAFASYNAATADSQRIAEAAADGQLELTKALSAAGIKTGELTTLGGPFARAWQNSSGAVETFLGWLRNIPGVGNLVAGALKPVIDALGALVNRFKEAWSNANATQGLEQASVALGNLQAQAGAAQNAAGRLFAELKAAGGPPNTAQTEQIQRTAEALNVARNQAVALRDQYLALAAAARNSGNEQLAQEYERLAQAAGRDIKLSDVRLQQLNSLLPANQKITAATKEQEAAIKARAAAEAQLNKIIGEAPVRNLEAQLAIGQQLLGLSKALADREQSRFGIVRAGLQFELQTLEQRGAGESAIAAKKAEIDRVDRAALQARYQALVQQQKLEEAMLRLSQEKARQEANLSVLQQRSELLKAQAELQKALASGDKFQIDAAQAQVNLQREILGVQEQKADTLIKTQPIERAIAAAAGETARNGLQAEAAAKGYRIAADGSLVATRNLSAGMERVAVFSGQSAKEQERFRGIAQQAGLAIGRAADGSLILGRTQQDVTRAAQGMNSELGKTAGGYNSGTRAAGGTKTATDQLRQSLVNAGVAADDVAELIGDSGSSARDARGSTDALRNSLAQGKTPAGDIANAFVSTGKNAPAAAQGARDFAAWLSKAKEFAQQIANLNLANGMTAVRDRTREAAIEAQRFYDWLLKASNLPGSRWTGGPVEAGAEYRVNELGQEALLSAGRLSLINAPQNAIWRAPSSGVVVPAGITARLQEAGALPSPGGMTAPAGTAELAVEIGKLRQEVGELARRQWNINVTQRTGPTGSQVLRTLQQLR
jgi:tape measure domain-containing protein